MTLLDQTLEDTRATAAATGASATERFRADKASLADTPPERCSRLCTPPSVATT